MASSKRSLRARYRNRRRDLPPSEQERAALALKRLLVSSPELRRAKRIAFYVAQDGEIDPAHLLTWCLDANRDCYLPVLAPGHHDGFLWFGRVRLGDDLEPNRFGIPEPRRRVEKRLSPWTLDLMLVPLVAFDDAGHRLGMGGGFYDRTLDFDRRFRRPLIMGIAHHFQQAQSLPAESWDVTLDAVATDREILRFPGGR